jgi:hypothetical protein
VIVQGGSLCNRLSGDWVRHRNQSLRTHWSSIL